MISTVYWVGFYVFSAAALCVVFVKSHKKASVQGAVVDAVVEALRARSPSLWPPFRDLD